MISKYSGTCVHCGRPTKAGADLYDVENKESFHQECRDNPQPTPEVLALSQRLHYLSADAALHFHWSELRGDWQRTLWAMSANDEE